MPLLGPKAKKKPLLASSEEFEAPNSGFILTENSIECGHDCALHIPPPLAYSTILRGLSRRTGRRRTGTRRHLPPRFAAQNAPEDRKTFDV